MNLAAIICAIVLGIATVLPYAKASAYGFSQSKSLLDGGDGWFFLIAALGAIAFAITDKNIGVIVMGGIAVALMVFEVKDFADKTSSGYGAFIDKSVGYYLMIIASIGIVVSGIVKISMKKKY